MFEAIAALTPAALRAHRLDARGATGPASFWRIVSLARWSQRRRVRAYLATLGEEGGLPGIAKLCDALDLEHAVRPLRQDFAEVKKALRLAAAAAPPSITVLCRDIDRLLAVLRPVEAAATIALSCRGRQMAKRWRARGLPKHLRSLHGPIRTRFARHASRVSSRSVLEKLSGWFQGGMDRSLHRGNCLRRIN